MVRRSCMKLIQSAAEEVVLSPQNLEKKVRIPPCPTPKELLSLYKINARRNLSQNFLLDPRLLNKIVTKTGKVQGHHVCEVGPGPGNISRYILQNGAAHLTLIEKDQRFMPALQSLSQAFPGRVRVVKGDILDFSMETVFPKEFAQDWNSEIPPLYIIGNLPFNISTPLIIRWLRHISNHTGPFSFGRTRLSLTFQREVAERMIAKPNDDQRCRLSIMCQHLCNVDLLFTIPGRAFFPKPEVDVSLVKFTPLIKPLIKQPFKLVEKVMRVLFHCRQKYIDKGIQLLFPKDRIDLTEKILKEMKLDYKRTAMQLSIEEYSHICDLYSCFCDENKGLIDYDFRAPKRKKKIYSEDNESLDN